MPAKCVYCGSEVPTQIHGKLTCPVCGENQPAQAETSNQSGLSQLPEPEPRGPEFSAPPEADPGPDHSHSAPPPPPAPPQPGPESPAGPTGHTPAWELEGGFWLVKLWKTIWQVLLHPGLTFAAPGRIQIGRPLVFALIIALASSLVSGLFVMLLIDEELSGVEIFMYLLGSPFQHAIVTILGLFVFGGIFHAFLRMFKAAKGGYVTTFRVLSYASSIQIFIVALFLSILLELWWLLGFAGSVLMVWQVVVMVCGLAAAHGATYGRVIGAMLLWFAAILVLLLFLYILFIFLVVFTGNFAP